MIPRSLLESVARQTQQHCAARGYVSGPNWNPLEPHDPVSALAMARLLVGLAVTKPLPTMFDWPTRMNTLMGFSVADPFPGGTPTPRSRASSVVVREGTVRVGNRDPWIEPRTTL